MNIHILRNEWPGHTEYCILIGKGIGKKAVWCILAAGCFFTLYFMI